MPGVGDVGACSPQTRAAPVSYQSPAAHCVSLNKTNPFGGVTSAKNAALFQTTRQVCFSDSVFMVGLKFIFHNRAPNKTHKAGSGLQLVASFNTFTS